MEGMEGNERGIDRNRGDHVEVDLRPGTTVTVPMADGSQVTFDIAKKRGRPVAVVRGATRLRPVTRAKST